MRYRLKIISAKLMAVRKYCRVFSIHTYVILKQMHSARRKWFENWIDYAWIDFFMVDYIAITNLLTMRISSYDWKMTANIDIRKQSWQCFMSSILPTFLISRLYDTWFCPVLFHVHIIIRFKYMTYISWVFCIRFIAMYIMLHLHLRLRKNSLVFI